MRPFSPRLLAVRSAAAAIAVAIPLTGAGCGDDGGGEGAAAPSSEGAWVLGAWTGELQQRGMSPFRVRATVRSLDDAQLNDVRYSGLDCRGTWAPLGAEGPSFRFRETITSGRSDRCKGVGTVSLRREPAHDPGTAASDRGRRLLYLFRGGGVESRGYLRPQGSASAAVDTASAQEPARDAMAQTDGVRGAPGRELVLSKVTVPPGANLPLHRHRGTQVARVESGTLTYTVRSGSAVVRRGQSDRRPRIVRTIHAGETARIRAGEWIVEQPSDIHRAANRGGSPVVIYLATLLEAGAPPATPLGG